MEQSKEYSKYTKSELIAECRKEQIGSGGNKKELIESLESNKRMKAITEKEKPLLDEHIPCDSCSQADFIMDVNAPSV